MRRFTVMMMNDVGMMGMMVMIGIGMKVWVWWI